MLLSKKIKLWKRVQCSPVPPSSLGLFSSRGLATSFSNRFTFLNNETPVT